jgi:hypothetical protein
MDDGRIVIAGGGHSIEVLDLAAKRSQIIARIAERRSSATLNRLGSGDFVVIGGYDDRIEMVGELQVISSTEFGSQL